jgi:hypothetical protein
MCISCLSGEAVGFSGIFSARPKQVKSKWLRCGSLTVASLLERMLLANHKAEADD